ncbi:MAG: hypothetical protein J6B71_08660 [Clostridia bacterium]|nr:hypothetical protein [Clostridia bacterium]MBP3300317.1 hypothetical protein [Clostridia bacterium]
MKFTKIISLLLVSVLGIGALASCANVDDRNTAALNKEALTYVSLRINPEIELLADEDDKVVAANAVNEDGEVVLSTVDLEGKTIEEAGAIFTETANDLGYFTPDGKKDTVYIDVESTTGIKDSELEEKLDKSIRDYFNNKGINGKIAPETLDKYADKAAEWGISAGHVKLVMRVLDAHPELTDTEVLELGVKDWMQLLKGNKDEEKVAAGLKADYRAEIDTLKGEYARLFELRTEIETLEAQLEGELTDEEKSAIEAQISEKEAELKPLQDEYKAKAGELKDTYKESSKDARKEYRAEAEKRKNENKSKQPKAEESTDGVPVHPKNLKKENIG